MSTINPLEIQKQVVQEAVDSFQKIFGQTQISDLKGGISPGRVNLIGDHVDYVDGFVLPIAIPLYTVAIGHPVKEVRRNYSQIYSTHFDELVKLYHFKEDDDEEPIKLPKWAKYAEGIFELHRPQVPLDLVVHSNVPVGAGLSSSASFELALYYLFDQFNEEHLTTENIAKLCQKAEHEYGGVPCGIMDQFVCSLAEDGHALKIDCRDLSYERIPLEISKEASFVIVDTGVKHALASGEYAKRRSAVEQTLEVIMGAKSWRDVTGAHFEDYQDRLSQEERNCGRHVIGEIARTDQASKALLQNDAELFGRLMWESHDSLKNLYRVSCDELDELVHLARSCSGVFGARMTGGGFGGCIVALVAKDHVAEFRKKIEQNYSGHPRFFTGIPVGGASILDVSKVLKELR